ncbi:TetR/AcrR family transcriptional regulator [Gluconacetobacter sacchari]|nr:TetR/AcrR family transcriptional regulator [Gluconacetobacter sacchari]
MRGWRGGGDAIEKSRLYGIMLRGMACARVILRAFVMGGTGLAGRKGAPGMADGIGGAGGSPRRMLENSNDNDAGGNAGGSVGARLDTGEIKRYHNICFQPGGDPCGSEILSMNRAARSPGRPLDNQSLPDEIMSAAESLFARSGYFGTSVREIANKASVNSALISYYFGGKENLFRTIFRKQGMEIVGKRMELLDALRARFKGPIPVDQIVRAYLSPQCELKKSGPRGLAFIRIQAQVHNEFNEMYFSLRREIYDESTKQYIGELERSLPGISLSDITWRMMFLIGAYLYMLADLDRMSDLSDHRFEQGDDTDELLERLTIFVSSGMSAPTVQWPPVLSTTVTPARRRRAVRTK